MTAKLLKLNTGTKRPMPPEGLGDISGEAPHTSIVPAKGLGLWVQETFIREGGALFNPEHQHLSEADLEFLWAGSAFVKQGRTVLGQAEEVMFRAGGWQKERQEQQMLEWFGHIPKFLITLAADYCVQSSDADFCALVEHELYHVGQKKDDFGAPAFTRDGLPKLSIRGHDVEEFLGVVKRYGVGDPGGALAQLAGLARGTPEVSRSAIAGACGTCLLKAA